MTQSILAIHPKKRKLLPAQYVPGFYGPGTKAIRFDDSGDYFPESEVTVMGVPSKPGESMPGDDEKVKMLMTG